MDDDSLLRWRRLEELERRVDALEAMHADPNSHPIREPLDRGNPSVIALVNAARELAQFQSDTKARAAVIEALKRFEV